MMIDDDDYDDDGLHFWWMGDGRITMHFTRKGIIYACTPTYHFPS